MLTKDEKEQRRQLISQIHQKGFTQVMEEAAYTWFNRFVALRFMEVNGYLPSKVRVFTDENGSFKPEIMKQAMTVEIDGLDRSRVLTLLDAQANEELYKYLLITQCNALNAGLPYMFEKIANPTELLFPANLLRPDSVLGQMVDAIPEEDWTDQVQIIGWLYQYYISEKHEEVIDPLHGKAVKKEDIPAATQLFTTDWVVRYILDNSLGRYWIERHPESRLAEKLSFLVTPKSGRFELVDENIRPEELKVLDPCVGSGHFLSYAFDVLMEIYRENGWSDRDAAKSIIENNLFGLDIDDRAAQLAYFAVMMKARKYNRRIISADTSPHIMAMQDSVGISDELIKYVSKNDKSIQNDLVTLRTVFANAKEYGSIISVPKIDYRSLYMRIGEIKDTFAENFMDMSLQAEALDKIPPLIKQAEILSGKYNVVVTNPPYLNRYSSELKSFVCAHYEAYKGDLFSVFMFRNFAFCKSGGYSGLMTPNVWMFIKTYENLRNYIINEKSIVSLIQMAKGAFFKEATVDICAFVLKNAKEKTRGLYLRLEDFKGDMEVQRQKVLEALADKNCGYFYEADRSNFSKIPGSPVAYWVSDHVFCAFDSTLLKDIASTKQGFKTGDNDRFLRLWFEVSTAKARLYTNNGQKWAPCTKGGEFRRWYGNLEYVVNWDNDGYLIKNFYDAKGKLRSRPQNLQINFKPAISWSSISSSKIHFRLYDEKMMYESKGPVLTSPTDNFLYILAYVNSKVYQSFIDIVAPTLDYSEGSVLKAPYKRNDDSLNRVIHISGQSVSTSKSDWDSYETSWDFKRNPMV